MVDDQADSAALPQATLATLDDLLAHAAWMRALAGRLLGDGDEADDVVQEAWLSALRAPPARGLTLRPWIATVVLNLVRTRARRASRARARERLLAAPEPVPTADELLVQQQTERRLAELVLALDEPYRSTILRRFHDGHSSAEIARAAGLPEGTVRWRLKYALDELRRQFAAEAGADDPRRALLVLVPLARLPVAAPLAPPPVSAPPLWLGPGAVVPAKLSVMAATAVGAAAALAVVGVGVHQHRARARAAKPASAAVAMLPAGRPTPSPAAFSPSALPAETPPSADVPAAESPGPPPPLPSGPPPPPRLTGITGLVRDSQGFPAAHVPVTIRRRVGTGAADVTTVTDADGRFAYRLQSDGSFVLTAELQGEPAARLQIDAPAKLAASLDEAAAQAAPTSFATIAVALAEPGRRLARPAVRPTRRLAMGLPPSRWCCRDAVAVGDVVYGRACLKFDDSRPSEQSGCDLYRLKAQVTCQHRIHGGVSTGDLSRTERLDCDGRVM
jgi:RNA polymerase sigma-70 factor (ECF subfamily)